MMKFKTMNISWYTHIVKPIFFSRKLVTGSCKNTRKQTVRWRLLRWQIRLGFCPGEEKGLLHAQDKEL